MSMFDYKVNWNPDALKTLESFPLMIQNQVIDKAIPAMVRPIIEKAKAIAPRSDVKGAKGYASGSKWGKKVPKSGTKNFNPVTWRRDHSADHIGYRINKKGYWGAYVKVGFRSPRGNKARFNQFKHTHRRVVYWGEHMGFTYEPPYRVMQRAYDETIPAQMSAFTAALQNFKLP